MISNQSIAQLHSFAAADAELSRINGEPALTDDVSPARAVFLAFSADAITANDLHWIRHGDPELVGPLCASIAAAWQRHYEAGTVPATVRGGALASL